MSATTPNSPSARVAQGIAQRLGQLPQVEAVALGGSRASDSSDTSSDVDLYVYHREPISLAIRREIAAGASRAEIGNDFWEPGDEWIDLETGISVDVMFRHVSWIEEQLDRVLRQHRASVGYSTCFWYNVLNSQTLFDRQGWFDALKASAEQPYPLELKRAVIAKNYPILRRNLSSYVHQIELAIARSDFFSIHHRTTALLASYFDILFALNEQPHPGEKRLVLRACELCSILPGNFSQAVDELLSLPEQAPQVFDKANLLLDELDALLRREGFLSESGEVRLQG